MSLQFVSLNQSTSVAASPGSAAVSIGSSEEACFLKGLLAKLGTTSAQLTTTPWRARDNMTESTRASSDFSATVVALKSGRTPSSSPTTNTQSNCCPFPTCPVKRCTPGAVIRVVESPTRIRALICAADNPSRNKSSHHCKASTRFSRTEGSRTAANPAASSRKSCFDWAMSYRRESKRDSIARISRAVSVSTTPSSHRKNGTSAAESAASTNRRLFTVRDRIPIRCCGAREMMARTTLETHPASVSADSCFTEDAKPPPGQEAGSAALSLTPPV